MLVDCLSVDAERAIKRLCEFFDTPYIPVRFSDNTTSAFMIDQTGMYIILNTTYLNWLIVCHEFAHFWCWQIDQYLVAHGKAHAKLTQKAVRYIERRYGINDMR